MIRPEQLAEALDRIHPRDRELLSLSLRRRVPDEALGRLYECSPSEVARLRARAIERLADEMDLQRGEDLGAVLKALLEPDTWSQAASHASARSSRPAAGRSRLAAVPVPAGGARRRAAAPAPAPAPATLAGAALAQEPRPRLRAEPAPAEPRRAEPARAGRARARPRPLGDGRRARARGARPAPARGAAGARRARRRGARRRGGRRSARPSSATTSASSRAAPAAGGDGTRHFVPEKGGPLAAPFPTEPGDTACYSTAYDSRARPCSTASPAAAKRLRITPQTEWGSPRVLGVVSQRGDWLGVQASELKNGEIAWIPRSATTLDCVSWSLHADLSKRELFVRHDGHTVRKLRVAIGRRDNPTPKGRFTRHRQAARSRRRGLALRLLRAGADRPPDRPAARTGPAATAWRCTRPTTSRASASRSASAACARVATQARWLINHIPLGSPVFIHA